VIEGWTRPAPGIADRDDDTEIIAGGDGQPVQVWRHFDVRRTDTLDRAPAIVLCHGFVQNRFAWRSPQRSLDDALLDLGAVLWSVEMRGRGGGPTAEGVHAYVDDLAAVVRHVAARHDRVALVGHSLGGLVGAALPADAHAALAAIATIGAPLLPGDPRLHQRGLERPLIAAARALHRRRVPFAGRRFGQALHLLASALDVPYVPWPTRLWSPGSLDGASLAFALKNAFADDSHAVFADLLELLITDGRRAGGVDVGARLPALRKPLLVIAGADDDLAPPAGARPLYERAGAAEKAYVEVPCGHIDLLIGRRAPSVVWAPLSTFLRRHLGLGDAG
jgi:pimeloyl-ACP methyl ester carboxylesterase